MQLQRLTMKIASLDASFTEHPGCFDSSLTHPSLFSPTTIITTSSLLCASLSHASALQTAVQEEPPAAHHPGGRRGGGEGAERGQLTAYLLGRLLPLHLPPGTPHLPRQGGLTLRKNLPAGGHCRPHNPFGRAARGGPG